MFLFDVAGRNETANGTANGTAEISESLDIQSIWKIGKSNFDPSRAYEVMYLYTAFQIPIG